MSPDQTPRRHFHVELDTLQERLLAMAGLVETLIASASQAVLERDPTVADVVIRQDNRVDELEIEIDHRVVELLALQQPMASDLRQIIATKTLSNDLERMGDHAVNIANAARRLSEATFLPNIRELAEMIQITREMVSDSLGAYVTRNVGTARMVCLTDDKVDDLRRSMYRILVTHMLEDPKLITGSLELLLISQNLERIADLATNISEDVVFLVEGRNIKHGSDRDPALPSGGSGV